ncbi:hypothetical protein ZIOFF_070928 [Zingiber officinale]|uniref:Peptidase M24 domain-containing protein n=1 Tax=Zingiber officinale TaxID=94328 RepID=A0A8J5C7S0_ZINOF|nr:hypothetical protein ZIOFF_070928 [Zingiber officinale]
MSDDEAREEKELDLTFPDVVTKYKTVAEIVNSGYFSLFQAIWIDLWGPLALYHACIPLFQAKLGNDENVLEENDIVKIDMGCHIDGFITVVAHTHVIQEGSVTGRAADVIAAANTAAEVALCLVRPGKKMLQDYSLF